MGEPEAGGPKAPRRSSRQGGVKEDRQGVAWSRKAGGQMAPRRSSRRAAVQGVGVGPDPDGRGFLLPVFLIPPSTSRELR